jgi:hypothetical protein
MKSKSIIIIASVLLSLTACGPSAERINEKEQHLQDSIRVESLSSSAAVETKKDSVHKFIRTADLKFRVKNVISSTARIEDIVVRHGGFVTYTNLRSQVLYTEIKAMSPDSSLESTHFSVLNDMVLRVPNTHIDTLLKDIAQEVDFLDHRIIKAEDVALQLLANRMSETRSAKNAERLARDLKNTSAKLQQVQSTEDAITEREAAYDQTKIANLSLRDQINFSTVNLDLYQRETVKRELLLNEKNARGFEPSMWRKLTIAFQTGWEGLSSLIIFLLRSWEIILVIGVAIFLFKKIKNKVL